MAFSLGIDVSTTASKALLLNEKGRVVATASAAHALSTPRPLWSEQDPSEWWRACCAAVRDVIETTGVDPQAIAAVGLAGQMHGLVLLGEGGEVLRPAILWNDQRAAAECDLIRTRIGKERLVRITGNDAFAGFSAPKLLWVREHEPDTYARIRHVLLPKDYVRLCLTGELATDRAGAGGTLLLDLRTRDWSNEVLDALEIPRSWLPATHEGTDTTGRVSASASVATRLAPATPIVAGAGDQAAQAVGVGAVSPDVFALTVGTSGVVFAPCDGPKADPDGRAHSFPHALPNTWHMMGVMLSAAGSLQWYRDTIAPDVPFDALIREAAAVPAGSDDLIFLPYLSGERTPHADPNVRGSFVGLTLRHTRGHLTRAVLEGVAFGLKDNLGLLAAAGVPPPAGLRASGGGVRSPLWRGILADVFDVDLELVETSEGAALGGAMLAGIGAGVFNDAEDACRACVRVAGVQSPDRTLVGTYEEAYRRFAALYGLLDPHYSS